MIGIKLQRLMLSFTCALLVVNSGLARAERDLHSELTRIADRISVHLQAAHETKISLSSLQSRDINIDARILQALRLKLTDRHIEVAMDARIVLIGKYHAIKLVDTKKLGIELNFSLFDQTRKRTLAELPAGLVTDVEEVCEVIGFTGALKPDLTQEQRQQEVLEAVETKAQPHVEGSAGLSKKGGQYSLEVLVLSDDGTLTARPLKCADDFLNVSLSVKDVYCLRLNNHSPHDAAVSISIDGLNVFAFSVESKQNPPKLLVPANSSRVIRGWPITLKKSAEFKVTTYGESAVKALGGDDKKIGVIYATFSAAWPEGSAAPKDEQSRQIATGLGQEIDAELKPVQRNIGKVREMVSIRYSR